MYVFRYAKSAALLATIVVGAAAIASPTHKSTSVVKHRPTVAKKSGHAMKKVAVTTRRKLAVVPPAGTIPVISGNISPNEIEVEAPPPADTTHNAFGTNLYPEVYMLPIGAANFPTNSPAYTAVGLNNTTTQAEIAKNPQNLPSLTAPNNQWGYMEDWIANILPNTDPKGFSNGVCSGIITANDIAQNSSLGSTVTGANIANSTTDYGHINGGRIVDGFANGDGDIFATGGKENLLYTWNVQPGSVGSSKYDATQMFLANTSQPAPNDSNFPTDHTKSMLFFGMERRGNNGTTEFEFEFNRNPPALTLTNKDGSVTQLATPVLDGQGNPTYDSNGNPIVNVLDPRYGYIPDRQPGDVLFAFEMNGSSTSGSCIPHIYAYDPNYNAGGPTLGGYDTTKDISGTFGALGPIANINQTTTWGGGTPSEPWGYVNSKGTWTIGQIPNFTAGKGAAYFGPDTPILKNLSNCGHAYVQVRTRASVTDGSDLKDTTRIIEYVFGGPKAGANSRLICAQKYFFDGKGSVAQPANSPLTYDWTFNAPIGVVLTGDGFNLTGDPTTGVWHSPTFSTPDERDVNVSGMDAINGATIQATLTVTENGNCTDTKPAPSQVVYQNLANQASVKGGTCNGLVVTFTGGFTGGVGPYNYQWDVYKSGSATPIYTKPGNGNSVSDLVFTAPSDGVYSAQLTVSDSRFNANDPNTAACQVKSPTGTVCAIDKINLAAFKDGASADGTAVNGHATYHKVDPAVTPCASQTITWQISKDGGKTWNDIGGFTNDSFTYSNFQTDTTGVASGDFTLGTDHYSGLVFTVMLRAHVVRTYTDGISRDSSSCEEFSTPLTLKKVIGADP